MKIAIMMRAMDQDSGHRAIIEGLVENMLQQDQKNDYLLMFRTTKWLGRFSSYENAKEVLLKAPHKFIWDQVIVPYVAWKERADIIFNPKFSVPLISHCPVVMGLHEPAWWAWPEHYEWMDVQYMKLFLPLYCRKSKHMFPISEFVVEENRKHLKLSFENVTVIYPAPKDYFHPVSDPDVLDEFKRQYKLPNKFIMSVTRVDHPGVDNSSSYFPGKNVETTLRAFIQCRDSIPYELVIAGRRVREYLLDTGWNESDLKNVHFTDFVPHEDLPKLYNLADLFIIPSYYESYAMALVEAMSCGCAVVASETGACPEITSGAALLADPSDPADFAAKITRVLQNEALKKDLKAKSLERATFFNWERSASLVLEVMDTIVKVRNRRSFAIFGRGD